MIRDPRETVPTALSRPATCATSGNLFLWCAATVLAVSVGSAVPEGRRSTESLRTLDPPGSIDTRAFGISDDGDIVGLYVTPDNRTHGFLLTRGVYSTIDIPGALRTNALGITILRRTGHDLDDEERTAHALGSHDVRRGLAVVGRYDTPDLIAHGYLLRNGVLTTIDVPGTTFTVATGINPSGHIVGRYLGSDGFFHGFTLIDGRFTTIDHPDGLSIHAMAINARGEIAGYFEDKARVFHGFQLSQGRFTTIDPPGSLMTGGPGGIVGINSREFVGSYRLRPATLPCGCDGVGAFAFKHGSYTLFDFPDAISTSYTGINGRGDVVGIYQDSAGRRHGFVAFNRADE